MERGREREREGRGQNQVLIALLLFLYLSHYVHACVRQNFLLFIFILLGRWGGFLFDLLSFYDGESFFSTGRARQHQGEKGGMYNPLRHHCIFHFKLN
jgi:hypothetical protein